MENTSCLFCNQDLFMLKIKQCFKHKFLVLFQGECQYILAQDIIVEIWPIKHFNRRLYLVDKHKNLDLLSLDYLPNFTEENFEDKINMLLRFS